MKLKKYSIIINNKEIPVIGFFTSGSGFIYIITAKPNYKAFEFLMNNIIDFKKVLFDKRHYEIVYLINMDDMKDFVIDNDLKTQFNKFKNEVKRI